MTADTTGAFVESARAVETAVSRVPAASAADRLRDVIEQPAVGVEPDIKGVSLPDPIRTDPSAEQLRAAATGVTGAALGVADYGSVVVRETGAGEEPASLFPDVHVAVLAASDIVPDMPTAFESFGPWLRDGGDAVVTTGPSATADMGELVRGAHGPKHVHVVVVTDR